MAALSAGRKATLAISIVVYETAEEELLENLRKVLVSIELLSKQSLIDTPVKINLVNNGNESLRQDKIERLFDARERTNCQLTILEGHGNIGYGRAQNLALHNDTSDLLVIMNPDVAIEESALSEGSRYMLDNPDVVAVSPLRVLADSSSEHLCKEYPTLLALFLRGFGPKFLKERLQSRLLRYEIESLDINTPAKGLPIISGCFIVCRQSAFNEIGGFDPRYFLYFEDFDFSLRLRKVGKLAFLPSMRISHKGGQTAKKGILHIVLFIRSALSFFNTHGWKWI